MQRHARARHRRDAGNPSAGAGMPAPGATSSLAPERGASIVHSLPGTPSRPGQVDLLAPAAAILGRPPPSTSGLGHHPFKVATRVRIPLGALLEQKGCAFLGEWPEGLLPPSCPHSPSLTDKRLRQSGVCPVIRSAMRAGQTHLADLHGGRLRQRLPPPPPPRPRPQRRTPRCRLFSNQRQPVSVR